LLELEIGWLRNDVPDEVEARITAYLELNPSDAWARRERVSFLQNRLALEEALAEAREARQFEPHHPASWQVEAGVLEAMNRTGDARDLLKHALELSIGSTYALRRLVLLADSPKEKEEALHFIWKQFERQSVSGPAIPVYREVAFPILEITDLSSHLRIIWEQRPDLWESWHTLLHQLIAVGDLDQAGKVAAGAAERFPTLPVVWRDAARLNQRLSAWPEATECLLHALRINPDWAPVVCDLAGIYRRAAKWEEARELLERSHRRNPMEATVLGNLADLLWHIEEREAALARVTRAVEINPDYNWGWNTLAQWSVLLRQNNIALEMARERARRLGKDASAWLLVSRLAQRPELAGERLDAALRSRECEPRNVDAHDTAALALAEQRRFEEALSACHPSAFGTRAPVPLRGREAWLLAQQGKRVDAVNKMKEVVAQDPSYFWGWDRLADWHFEANHFLDSLNACEKVLRLSPMEPSAYGKRARAYVKLTQFREAKLDYQKALALDPGYTFAGWQLFKMQVGEKDYTGAAATLSLMRSRNSPGVILPAEIILAGGQGQWDNALSTLRQVALSLEVDTGAVQEALKVLDAGKQQPKVDKLLTSLISNPELNPYIANLWANRINLVTKWNLFSYLKKIPAHSRALEAVLQYVVLGGKKTSHPVRLANRLIAKYPQATRQHTQVWSAIGQIFVSGARWNQAADWLKDWESRPDAQGWMVTNLVFSLQILGRIPEADAISQKLLSKGLRDHTAGYHLLYLTLSALERQDTGQARQLFQGVHLESNQKQDEFFKLAVEQALLVQEAPPGPERHAVSADARYRLSHFAMSERKSQRVKKAETRATLQIAKDSKTFSSSFYAFRTRLGSGFSPVLRNRFLRLIVILLFINALRMCSGAH
jgi:tetratricopeptide (TPR) repeat protein